jgi:hypothetical protein
MGFFTDDARGGGGGGWEEGAPTGADIEDVDEAETEGVIALREATCSSDFRAAFARPA